MKLYVGNLSFKTTDDALRQAFESFGQVASASIVIERETGRSRGFGFVEMPNDEEARRAIAEMHGKDFDGRNLTVNEARPKEPGSGGGRGGRRWWWWRGRRRSWWVGWWRRRWRWWGWRPRRTW